MTDQPSYMAWNGQQYPWPPPDGWQQAHDGRWYPGDQMPAQASPPSPPPPAAPPAPPPPQPGPAPAPAQQQGAGLFQISEKGKNGRAVITARGIDRVVSKALGRDDRQFIPFNAIALVSHDRKTLGRDVVMISMANGQTLEWKIAKDAEGFVNQVNMALGG